MAASDFVDEPTPLPAPFQPERDPRYPTSHIPRIVLAPDSDTADDAGALYPRWRFESPCRSVDELARLYAPYFDGRSIHLFTTDVRSASTRVALELVLATGQRVLAGIASVSPAEPTHGHPGMRFRLHSIDPITGPLLDELGDAGASMQDLLAEAMAVPEAVASVPENATTRMTKIEIAEVLGTERVAAWSDHLLCKLSVSSLGECAVPNPISTPHQTARTVVSELAWEPSPVLAATPAAANAASVRGPVRSDTDLLELSATLWWRHRWTILGATLTLGGVLAAAMILAS